MNDPYRSALPEPRYRLHLAGETLVGDRFADVIAQLRMRGFTTEQVVALAKDTVAQGMPGDG